MAHTACLVCFISTVNGHCNKKRKEKKKLTLGRLAQVAGTTTNLKQSILRVSLSMGQAACELAVFIIFKVGKKNYPGPWTNFS
jgi:hypothetical protein